MQFIHVISRQDSVFVYDLITEEYVIHLQIDHIHIFFAGQSHSVFLYVHQQSEPLFVILMPENSIVIVSPPGIFRQHLIFLPDIVKNPLLLIVK